MGYASWTKDYDPNESFEDKQWNEPLIVRCNKQVFKIFLIVNIARSTIDRDIKQEKPTSDIGNDTEVQVTLPIASSSSSNDSDFRGDFLIHGEYLIERLQEYYKKYRIGKLKNTQFSLIGEREEQ